MQKIAQRLGASHLRVAGAVGGVVACVGAGVVVAASPKPSGAPLVPPVDASVAVDRSTPSAAPCSTKPAGMATTPADPALQAALQQLRAATTRAERQAALRGLTADQRQQVTALLRRPPGGAAAPPPPPADCGVAQSEPMIQPDVVEAGPSAPPITNSYVS
jgi:hypothetical protein